MDKMLTFHSPCPSQALISGYGLGVIRYEPSLFNGLTVWGHSGSAPGYTAGCLYLPDYGVFIGIMDNTNEGKTMYVINYLLDILVDYLE